MVRFEMIACDELQCVVDWTNRVGKIANAKGAPFDGNPDEISLKNGVELKSTRRCPMLI